MFLIFATKPLNDRTSGFRFNILGTKGVYRKRKVKSNGFKIVQGDCMKKIHMGKRSIYIESAVTIRQLRHFAG